MTRRLIDRIPIAKTIKMLVIVFGGSFGLCCLSVILAISHLLKPQPGDLLIGLGMIGFYGMVCAMTGILITLVLWAIVAMINNFTHQSDGPQKLFDDEKNDE